MLRVPSPGFLVNTTPVALSSPMFPNAIDTMFTAVPSAISFVMLFFSLYTIALSPIQLPKTALIASSTCSVGSVGNGLPVCLSQISLYCTTIDLSDSSFNSLSPSTFCFFFASSKTSSNFLSSTPNTTLPNN